MDLDLASLPQFIATFGGCLVWDFWTRLRMCKGGLEPKYWKKL